MEWIDYEPLDDDVVNESIEKQDGNEATFSSFDEGCSTLIENVKDKYNNGNEEGETALDDIFQSLVNVEENVHGEMNGDEQTLSTAKSGKSNKSMKSQRSQHSEESSHSNLSLTEKLDKISKNEGKQVDDDERSASAMSWFSWRKTKKTIQGENVHEGSSCDLGKSALDDVDNIDDGSEDSSSDANSKQSNPITNIAKDVEQLEPIYFLEEIEEVNFEEEIQLNTNLASDLVGNGSEEYDTNLNTGEDVNDEHPNPNQALFDIIEHGFDSIDPYFTRGMERALETDEVKLCFAAYVFVFSPPVPTHFAQEFNYDIDKDLRYERLQQHKTGTTKRGWFNWKSGSSENNRAATTFNKTGNNEDDEEEYTYEIVPSLIAFAVWTEVLLHFGIDLAKLSNKKRDAALAYVKESLIQVGLLDSSFIDLSERMTSYEATSNTEQGYECEYIAAHHAINGQYGQYLRQYYVKLGDCLEHNKVRIFNSASEITSETEVSMQDYASGMLPYTLIRALDFSRAQQLLCDESFVRRRLEYFGLLEGTTIQITDIEIMVENYQVHQRHDHTLNISDFIEGSHQAVKDRVKQMITNQEGALEHGRCEEVGKVFHILAVSLMEYSMDVNGLEYLNKAKEFKERGQSQFDSSIGSITLSDTYHYIGVAYGNVDDLDKSLSYFKQALEIRRKLLGGDDLRVAETCQKMVSVLSIYWIKVGR